MPVAHRATPRDPAPPAGCPMFAAPAGAVEGPDPAAGASALRPAAAAVTVADAQTTPPPPPFVGPATGLPAAGPGSAAVPPAPAQLPWLAASPAGAHRSNTTTVAAGAATPGEPRNGVSSAAGRAPATAAEGALAPPARRPGGSTAPGRADRDPTGEPRSDAATDISALLVPHTGEEPRSGALL